MSYYTSKAHLKGHQSYEPSKLAVMKKKSQKSHNLHFEPILYSELLLSGRPAFESRSLQTLILKLFDLQGQKLIFLKDLIHFY